MTPKEKAEQLVANFLHIQESIDWTDNENMLIEFRDMNEKHSEEISVYWKELAKQCALIAVDEIIKADPILPCDIYGKSALMYWNEVKQEIEKL